MALIRQNSGCKVGWETYDNEAEARARGVAVQEQRRRMEAQGYDWGYQCPGEVVQVRRNGEPVEEWTVTVP